MAMKFFSPSLSGAAFFACLLTPLSSVAQGPAASHFEEVAKRLDTGGVFYTVVDLDGDIANFAGMGDALMDLARKEAGGAIPPGLSAQGIIKGLGLTQVKAVGMSSKKSGASLFQNRALVYMPEGREGIFKLLGNAAAPLQSPAFAPAGSDVVMESDLTLSAILEIAENVLQSIGDPNLIQQYKGLLGIPLPGLEMTAGDFIAKLNTRLLVAGRLETGKSFTLPDSPMALPAFRLVVSFDQLDFLFAAILQFAGQTGDKVKIEKGAGFELIRLAEPLAGEMAFFQPVLYHDLRTKRILLGTHLDIVRECLEGKTPLSGDPQFVKATVGLPKEGNEFSYITPAVFRSIQAFVKTAMESSAGSSGTVPGMLGGIMEQVQSLSAPPDQPLAGVRANLPEGMLFSSNSNHSFKAILPAIVVFPVAMISAAGFEMYGKTMGAARQAQNSTNDHKSEEREGEDDSHKAVRNNLQQIAFAAQSYFVDGPQSAEVTYEQLIEAELLFKLDPVSGESYKGLQLKKTGGTLSLKLPGGGTVTQTYGPVTD